MSNSPYKLFFKSGFFCFFLGLSSCSQPNRTLSSFNPPVSAASQMNAAKTVTGSIDISRFAFPLKVGQTLEYSGTGILLGKKVKIRVDKITQAEVYYFISTDSQPPDATDSSSSVLEKNDSHLLEKIIDVIHAQFGIANFHTSFPRYFLACAGSDCATQINSPLGSILATKVRHTNIINESLNQASLNNIHPVDPNDNILVPNPGVTYLFDISKPFSLDLNFSPNLGLVSVSIPKLNAGYTLTTFR